MIYYQCPKCQRIWQYPIDECPYCLIPMERKEGKGSKVIGSSKITIGSLNHKKVPYWGIVLEDDKGNKWPHKSMIEKNVGDEITYTANENAVSIWRIKYDPLTAIEETNKLLNFLPNKEDLKVLIIPQLDSPNYSYFRENTSPEFISAIIDFLIKNKIDSDKITVATQSFNQNPIEACAQKSGLLNACTKKGIMPFDLAQSTFVEHDGLEISKAVLDADLVINLPLLKGGESMATKNLFKVLKTNPINQKEAAEKLSTLPNIITIAEAEYTQRPNKTVIFTGLILGGKNTLKLDRIFSELVFHKQLPELVKDIKIEEIETNGRQIEEVRYNIESY